MDDRIKRIRKEEARSHRELYEKEALYAGESWLKKPVATVMELLGHFDDREQVRILDLGCGVGRNAIALALQLGERCRVDCVDLLEVAIEKLSENAKAYGVEDRIRGVVSPIESFPIYIKEYDLIFAVSALEHIDGEESLKSKLLEIQEGINADGLVCLIMNSGVEERNKATGEGIPAGFEVNLPTEKLAELLRHTFAGWEVLKETVVPQRYEIPRGDITSLLSTKVFTFVAKKV